MATTIVREIVARLVFDNEQAVKAMQEFENGIERIKKSLNTISMSKMEKGFTKDLKEKIKAQKQSQNDAIKNVRLKFGHERQFRTEEKESIRAIKDAENARADILSGRIKKSREERQLQFDMERIAKQQESHTKSITDNLMDHIFAENKAQSQAKKAEQDRISRFKTQMFARKIDHDYTKKAFDEGSRTGKQTMRDLNQLEKTLSKDKLRLRLDDTNINKAKSEIDSLIGDIHKLKTEAQKKIDIETKLRSRNNILGMIAGATGAMNAGSISGLAGGVVGLFNPVMGFLTGNILSLVENIASSIANGIINGVKTGIAGIQDVMSAGIGQESIVNKYKAVFQGNNGAAFKEFQYANQLVKDLGLNYQNTAESYSSFLASTINSGVAVDKSRKMFTQMAEVITSLHLTSEQTYYVFLALEQMFNKGTVSMEELRRQLGEQIPGAFELFAQSMGISTSKLSDMIKQGEVWTTKTVPKFLDLLNQKYTANLEQARKSTQANLERIGYYWFTLKNIIWASGMRTGLTEIFSKVAEFLSGERVTKFAQKLGNLFKSIAQSKEFTELLNDLQNFADKIVEEMSKPDFLEKLSSMVKSVASILDSSAKIAFAVLPAIADGLGVIADMLDGTDRKAVQLGARLRYGDPDAEYMASQLQEKENAKKWATSSAGKDAYDKYIKNYTNANQFLTGQMEIKLISDGKGGFNTQLAEANTSINGQKLNTTVKHYPSRNTNTKK